MMKDTRAIRTSCASKSSAIVIRREVMNDKGTTSGSAVGQRSKGFDCFEK